MFRIACILVIVATSVYTKQIVLQPHLEMEAKCRKEASIGDKFIDLDLAYAFDSADTDPNMKCYSACIFREREMVNDNGTLHLEKILTNLPDNVGHRRKIVTGFRRCARQVGENFCDTAYNSIMCVLSTRIIVSMHPSHPRGTSHREN